MKRWQLEAELEALKAEHREMRRFIEEVVIHVPNPNVKAIAERILRDTRRSA